MYSEAKLRKAILSGDMQTVKEGTRQWVIFEHSTQEFQEAVLCPAIETIRQQFAQREFFLPELLVSLRAAKTALSVFDAAGKNDRPTCGKVVVGSLGRNNHGFCRKVIVDLLEVCGWDVVDIGENVPPSAFADTCIETGASVLVVAALSFAPGRMSSVVADHDIELLLAEMDARGIRRHTRVLVVGFASGILQQETNEVDAICDDLAEVSSVVHQLAASRCA